ncbi:M23 family metallopeptidase [Novosphingobium aerophilum]|uniref:M23 family metallopeptidase n=1 Tax=Novosphingobium aerophilum TaxID=2839843 RepID=UPI002E286139|nr:M23 family metallopeptidase [Novosphingobium aerophilum]
MVALAFVPKLRLLAGLATAAASLLGANPAFANASANADILAPLRAAQAARHQSGDEEFRTLFSSWQSLDQGAARTQLVAPALNGGSRIGGVIPGFSNETVSIPSLVPVEGVKLTSDFGMRWHPVLGGRRAHKGVDLAAPAGTPIRASADGVVERADWFAGYGLYVALEHGGQIETRYGHMSRLNVAAGQRVRKGDVIGYVGSTGRSTGPHLHYEVRIAGEAVNPVPYLQSGAVAPAGAAALAMGDGEED